MKTNLEKYNYYLSTVKERHSKFVTDNALDIPVFLYAVSPNGNIITKIVGIPYYYDQKAFSKEKPTKIDVANIKAYSESENELSLSNIYIPYHEISSVGKSSSAVKYTEYGKFMTKEQAEIKSIEVKEKIEAENILLQNGHSRCQYCRKVYPDSEKVKEKMISIYTFGREGKWMEFCSKTCAMHNQMSLEG